MTITHARIIQTDRDMTMDGGRTDGVRRSHIATGILFNLYDSAI